MKTTKQKLTLALFLAISLLFTFVACKQKPDDKPAPTPPSTTWTITFISNGDVDEFSTQVVLKGTKVKLEPNSFQYDDTDSKLFGGWSIDRIDPTDTDANQATPDYFDNDKIIVNSDITLYGRWGTPVTVTFDKTNGSLDFGEQKLVKEFLMPLKRISDTSDENGAPTGKEFAGWANHNEKQVIARNGNLFKSPNDCTLDAIWMGFNTVDANATFSMGGGQYGREVRGGSHQNNTVYKPITVKFTKKFEMSDHEVTQKEWRAVTGVSQKDLVNSSEDYIWSEEDTDEYDFYPVAGVTWEQAVAYCNKLTIATEGLGIDEICYTLDGVDWTKDIKLFTENSLLGVKCDFTKKGYRLPTEAEWEYCAKDIPDTRSGDDSAFAAPYEAWSGTGDKSKVNDYAVRGTREDGVKNILKPVMSKLPNNNGYYDMSGSVWEWCWNSFATYPDSDEVQEDYLETQEPEKDKYMYRGGGWDSGTDSCRVTNRNNGKRSQMLDNVGFRVCRTIE